MKIQINVILKRTHDAPFINYFLCFPQSLLGFSSMDVGRRVDDNNDDIISDY